MTAIRILLSSPLNSFNIFILSNTKKAQQNSPLYDGIDRYFISEFLFRFLYREPRVMLIRQRVKIE
jgi:hypothetical protein